jgi:hypothetical protein
MNVYGTEKGPFIWNKNPMIIQVWNSITMKDLNAVSLRLN